MPLCGTLVSLPFHGSHPLIFPKKNENVKVLFWWEFHSTVNSTSNKFGENNFPRPNDPVFSFHPHFRAHSHSASSIRTYHALGLTHDKLSAAAFLMSTRVQAHCWLFPSLRPSRNGP